MKEVLGIAPTRVDLAGGTLDLWPVHHLLDHKTTVNIAIDLPALVKITLSPSNLFEFCSTDLDLQFKGDFKAAATNQTLPLFGLMLSAIWSEKLPALAIHTTAKSPAGAGLGGSSCLAVTLGASLWRARQFFEDLPDLPQSKLVQIAQDIEARLIAAPTGCQDYWGAVRGSVNIIEFPYGGVEVTTIDSTEISQTLNKKLIVCYSGRSRASAINNWEIYKRVFNGDSQVLKTFNQIGEAAESCGKALVLGDIDTALQLSLREWKLRCQLWPAIETPETMAIDIAAKDAGAIFSRVCGAGGGGVMAILADEKNRSAVIAAATKAGGTILDAGLAHDGLKVN